VLIQAGTLLIQWGQGGKEVLLQEGYTGCQFSPQVEVGFSDKAGDGKAVNS